VSCEVPALALRVEGGGSSRRRAEQQAAAQMLAAIEALRTAGRS
jgi:dsRNA-specific ribonuclease